MNERRRILRRVLGVAAELSPVFLLVASLVWSVLRGSQPHPVGVGIITGALAIGALNFHLSFVRGLLYRRANGSIEGYRHVSGFPLIGSVLVVIGAAVGFGSALCATLGLLAMALDTGGSVWFLIATWEMDGPEHEDPHQR